MRRINKTKKNNTDKFNLSVLFLHPIKEICNDEKKDNL